MPPAADPAQCLAPSPESHRIRALDQAMLGLDVDVKTMLPNDVSSDGFDNIAAVLRTSPAFLEQYIAAARNISRQAIGRASGKPSSREYRVSVGMTAGTSTGCRSERAAACS